MTGRNISDSSFQGMSRLQLRPWRELSALALMVMELSWLVAGYQQLVNPSKQVKLPLLFLLLGSLILSVYWLTRWMLALKLRKSVRRVLLGTLLMVGYAALLRFLLHPFEQVSGTQLLLSLQSAFADPQRPIPVEFALFLLTAYLWFRGAALARHWIGINLVRRTLQFGVFMLLLLGVIGGFRPPAPFHLTLMIFLIAGFVAMGSARASTLKSLRGAAGTGFRGIWYLSILAFATVFVQSAAAIGGVAAEQLPPLLLSLIVFIGRILLVIGALLASPILLILALISPWLKQRLSSLPIITSIVEEIDRLVQFLSGVIVSLGELLRELYLDLPDIRGAKPFVLWFGIVLIAGLLLWVIGRYRLPRVRPIRPGVEDQRSFGQYPARLWLQARIQDGLGRLNQFFSIGPPSGYLGALRIRRIYTQLTRLCERLDTPRAMTATPLEYLRELELLFPDEHSELRVITNAYNRVRYGEYPETNEEVSKVERAWRQIRQSAKDLQFVTRKLAGRGLEE
jgi:hypothetical protein